MTAERQAEKRYLDELSYRLQLRGLPPDKIGDILAEVEAHLVATGEPARAAFGTPAEYAAMWASRSGRQRWPVIALGTLVAACSGFALAVGVLGVVDGRPTSGVSSWWAVALGLVLLAACLVIRVNHLIDPLTGQLPRGIGRKGLAALATGGAVGIVVAGFAALVGGALLLGRGDPAVGLDHGLLVAIGVALVIAATAILPVARITDPRSGRPFFRTRRRLILTIPALAILIALAFFALGVILR